MLYEVITSPEHEVVIVSKEPYPPYDRIHLCALVNKTTSIEEIALELPSGVKLELNAEVAQIDRAGKRIYTKSSSFVITSYSIHYTKLYE